MINLPQIPVIEGASLIVVSIAAIYSYKSFLKDSKTDIRDTVNGFDQEGLDNKTILKPEFSGWNHSLIGAGNTQINFKFFGRASVERGTSVVNQRSADNTPWTLTDPKFEDSDRVQERIENIDLIESCNITTKYGYMDKYTIFVELSTTDPSKCHDSASSIIEVIRDEYERQN